MFWGLFYFQVNYKNQLSDHTNPYFDLLPIRQNACLDQENIQVDPQNR